jgi:hypothetical protein
MRISTKILSLGLKEWSNAVRESLTPGQRVNFCGVSSCWELCALPQTVLADIAVLHHTFAPHDTRYAAAYIRRRWPDAVILIIGEQADILDDPLYDDKAGSGISTEELISLIDESVGAKRRMLKDARTRSGTS